MTSGIKVKTRGLLGRVDFSDKTNKILEAMCEIIVNGSDNDYLFVCQEDRARPVSFSGNELKVDMDLIKSVNMRDLEKELMQRIGLITVKEGRDGAEYVKPTEMALELYKDLRQEELLDERGYLIKTST